MHAACVLVSDQATGAHEVRHRSRRSVDASGAFPVHITFQPLSRIPLPPGRDERGSCGQDGPGGVGAVIKLFRV